jgi:hypothetical protein
MSNRGMITGLGLIFGIAVAGIAVGYGFGTSLFSPPTATTVTVTSTLSNSTTTTGPSSPFDLTLVITTNNIFNSSVGDQPAYYILGPNGLQSAASISLPAHRLIRLEIICYDDGAANLTSSQYAKVSGTQNGTVSEVNNDNVNSSQGASGIQVTGGESLSILPEDGIAHTFTIPELGLNIPIAPSSTVVAYFTITQTGTFNWFCQTECGAGSKGLLGAMATPGWMYGEVVAS